MFKKLLKPLIDKYENKRKKEIKFKKEQIILASQSCSQNFDENGQYTTKKIDGIWVKVYINNNKI